MPRTNKNGTEQNNDGLEEKIREVLPTVTMTTDPVVICGVNRRIGLAHYEHVDIYAGIAIPVSGVSTEDMDSLREAIKDAAEFGFNAVSNETYVRYKLLLDAQKNTQA